MMPGSLIAVTPLACRYAASSRSPRANRSGVMNTGANDGSSRLIPDSHQCPATKSTMSDAAPWPAICSAVTPKAVIAAVFR